MKLTLTAFYSNVMKNSLYDTYKMAIRWASDQDWRTRCSSPLLPTAHGLMVTSTAGVRACLAEEFSTIHVLHLRGDATDIWRAEAFTKRRRQCFWFSGTRTPVAVTLLVKNPNATYKDFKIQYRDIGDYLTREEKLETLSEAEIL